MRRTIPLLLVGTFLLTLAYVGGHQPAAADGPNIYLRAGSFDPLQDTPEMMTLDVTMDASDATYLLQFIGPIREEWKQAVSDAGADLHGYVPDYAFIAQMDAATVERVSALSFVRWVGAYRPDYRLAPDLEQTATMRATSEIEEPEALTLVVQTLPDADLDALAGEIEGWGGEVEHRGATSLAGSLVVVLEAERLTALAQQPGVVWIERYIQPELLNDVGGGDIMGASDVRSSLGLYGAGETVAVADSGLDVGTTGSAMSDDFEGRIVSGESICTVYGGRSSWSDLNGHGTHVAGSVLGSGVYSGSDPDTHDYAGSFAGVAPEAGLVFQSVDNDGDPSLECVPLPSDMDFLLFGPAYDAGARIHTNSWGGRTGGTSSNPEFGGYTSAAQAVDASMWDRNDLLILFAAGNSGVDADSNGVVDADSMASPATSKNALTVGASENYRPGFNTATYNAFNSSGNTVYPVDPIRNDPMGNDEGGMAAFSSRGPTDDYRIKPDIVAPGTWIVSARSHQSGAGTGWGALNSHYTYNGGTSMATPLTAGAAAIVREWLGTRGGTCEPSAALIKATLLNGAADMSPGQYGTGGTREIPSARPNSVTGWGRVDLVQSIDPPAPTQIWLRDEPTGLQTDQTTTYSVTLGASTPLRYTLAWSDYPGQSGSGKTLVNDLDLEIKAPDGTRYYGNGDADLHGICRRGNADACNNAESVFVSSPISGTYSVTVRAYNVAQGPQSFALVGSGDSLRTAGSSSTPPAGLTNKSYLPAVSRSCS